MNRAKKITLGVCTACILGATLVSLAGCTTSTTKKPRNPYNDQAEITQRKADRKYNSAPD